MTPEEFKAQLQPLVGRKWPRRHERARPRPWPLRRDSLQGGARTGPVGEV